MVNLAADQSATQELVLAMNGKLEAIIKTDIDIDDGREMPNIPFIDWTIERVDL